MARFVLRYKGVGERPTVEFQILDQTDKMLLVEASEEEVKILNPQDWLVSPEIEYKLIAVKDTA